MPKTKFTVVKQRVFIVEAESDSEANNIVTHELLSGARVDSPEAFFAADYTDIYAYGVDGVITKLAYEFEPEKPETRRVSGYTDPEGVLE